MSKSDNFLKDFIDELNKKACKEFFTNPKSFLDSEYSNIFDVMQKPEEVISDEEHKSHILRAMLGQCLDFFEIILLKQDEMLNKLGSVIVVVSNWFNNIIIELKLFNYCRDIIEIFIDLEKLLKEIIEESEIENGKTN